MGRPPIGKAAMTDAERQRRYRTRLALVQPEPGNYRVSFLLRADSAWRFAVHSGPDDEIDEDCCQLAETAAAAWTALAKQLREIRAPRFIDEK
jgi:hypothetical protein